MAWRPAEIEYSSAIPHIVRSTIDHPRQPIRLMSKRWCVDQRIALPANRGTSKVPELGPVGDIRPKNAGRHPLFS